MAFAGDAYNRGMTSENQSLVVLLVVAIVWLIVVLGFAIYFIIRVLPDIRRLRETPGGQHDLIKALFPPRFHR